MGEYRTVKILLACEESQVVCKAFRTRGHDAYSCDIEPCSGGHPEWHLQQDVTPLLEQDWDLIVVDEAHKIAWARVVGGVHFPTDTAGGRILAESFVKELLKNPKFIDQVNKARAEAAPFLLKKAA